MSRFQVKEATQLQITTEAQLEQLNTQGYVVIDHFTQDLTMLASVRKEVELMAAEGVLQQAGMSKGETKWVDKAVRGDMHLWLNDRDRIRLEWPNVVALLDKMDAIRQEWNAATDFQSQQTQTQIACYPGEGAKYVRHLDAFGQNSRRITVLYYMNVNWQPEDGGCLRCYPNDENGKEIAVDVEPLADRLLMFQSRWVEHEVLPAFARRYAITMWFY